MRFSHQSKVMLSALLAAYVFSLYCKCYEPLSVWSGFIMFAYMVKSSRKRTWIYAADVKRRPHFQDKNIGVIMFKTKAKAFRVSHLSS